MFPHTLNIINSALASSLRGWRGTLASESAQQPEQQLVLYDREGSAKCRLVREALTELNLDCMVYPCPLKGSRYSEQLKALSGSEELPFLHDPNSGAKLRGPRDIINYLFNEYTEQLAPGRDTDTVLGLFSSMLASQVRLYSGVYAKPSKQIDQPLVLYSFESSPYSRPVRERLCELELPYLLVNLSKQRWSELGPASFRLQLGEYKPLPGSKREAFLEAHGEVQVPYLVDPNTGTELFESKAILAYLNEHYQQH